MRGGNDDGPVDFGRVPFAAGDGLALFGPNVVDEDLDGATNLLGQLVGGNVLRHFHQPLESVATHLVGNDAVELIGRRAGDGFVLEAAGPVDFGLLDPVEEEFEILLGLAGEADDEVGANGQIGADVAPGLDTVERLHLIGRTAHRLQHLR